MVIDEHGSLQGLVTLEDALEEIVGEIMDEEDKVDPEFVKISAKSWRVLAKADFEDINKRLDLKIKVNDEFDTIGGFVLSKIGRIPKEMERVKIGKNTFIVEKIEGQRIKLLKVIK